MSTVATQNISLNALAEAVQSLYADLRAATSYTSAQDVEALLNRVGDAANGLIHDASNQPSPTGTPYWPGAVVMPAANALSEIKVSVKIARGSFAAISALDRTALRDKANAVLDMLSAFLAGAPGYLASGVSVIISTYRSGNN